METYSYKHILFAMDLSVESTIMLKKAASLAEIFKADLNIIHIYDSDENNSNETKDSAIKVLEPMLEPLNIKSSNVFVETGSVQDNILKIIENKKIDLVVIGSHGRKGISPLVGATATAMLSDLNCDVLSLSVLRYPGK